MIDISTDSTTNQNADKLKATSKKQHIEYRMDQTEYFEAKNNLRDAQSSEPYQADKESLRYNKILYDINPLENYQNQAYLDWVTKSPVMKKFKSKRTNDN